MQTNLGIVTVGSELLDGRVLDTNANYLCNEFNTAGFNVVCVLSCPDQIDLIKDAIKYAANCSDHIIVTGGLGPTTDDLTREAVSDLVGSPLYTDVEALEHIKNIFVSRRRPFEESNQKQALFPIGASIIGNKNGTAPGFSIDFKISDIKSCSITCLPGVPSELKGMLNESVLPRLKSISSGVNSFTRLAYKIFGLPESVVGARIRNLGFPEDVIISYRASFPEIHVILKFPNSKYNNNEIDLKVSNAIGSEWIFTRELSKTFDNAVHDLLISKGITIGTAESCTAGGISTLLTNCPGASAYFLGSFICYSNDLKVEQLGVPSQIIEEHGAVSKRTAEVMAINAKQRLGCDIALSITGIAGPDGGTLEKPVGTFYIGIATNQFNASYHYFYPGSRARVRTFAAYMSLDLLRRLLLGFAPQTESPTN